MFEKKHEKKEKSILLQRTGLNTRTFMCYSPTIERGRND